MDDRFFQAFLPGDHRVCGRKLRPYSAWHSLILHAINSPLVDDEGTCTPLDLIHAIRVVSTVYPAQPDLRPSIRDLIWVWRMNRNADLFSREWKLYSAYLADFTSRPRFWQDAESFGSTVTGPACLLMVAALISRSSLLLHEAWNMSLAEGQWLEATIEERAGARLNFFYEQDVVEGVPDHDINELSDDEIYEQAVKDLGKKAADVWMMNRRRGRTKVC